jgi:hypothetical protein
MASLEVRAPGNQGKRTVRIIVREKKISKGRTEEKRAGGGTKAGRKRGKRKTKAGKKEKKRDADGGVGKKKRKNEGGEKETARVFFGFPFGRTSRVARKAGREKAGREGPRPPGNLFLKTASAKKRHREFSRRKREILFFGNSSFAKGAVASESAKRMRWSSGGVAVVM